MVWHEKKLIVFNEMKLILFKEMKPIVFKKFIILLSCKNTNRTYDAAGMPLSEPKSNSGCILVQCGFFCLGDERAVGYIAGCLALSSISPFSSEGET